VASACEAPGNSSSSRYGEHVWVVCGVTSCTPVCQGRCGCCSDTADGCTHHVV
jgi:hypothetical protein